MRPESDQLLKLVQALLANADDLLADARLLLENERFARSYALAALAGEELGKIEFCLDWLLGTPTLTLKEFRRSWQSHAAKLAGLTAYRVAFIEDPATVSFEAVREQTQMIGRRKMEAIYVDFGKTGIVTPTSVGANEAIELLEGVEGALRHAARVLDPMTEEIVAATNAVAPTILAPLADHLEGLAPTDAIPMLRSLLTRLPTISNEELAAAIEANTVGRLLGLEERPSPQAGSPGDVSLDSTDPD